MSISQTEIKTISEKLIATHGRELMELVSMWTFFTQLARPLGQLGDINSIALTRLVVDKCEQMGKSVDALKAAVEDSERANTTIKYLLTLSD